MNDRRSSVSGAFAPELSGLTTAAITAVLDRLEAKGYVQRVRDEADRRRVLMEQTPLLRKRSEKIWGPIAREGTGLFDDFTQSEANTLIRFFRTSRELNERHAERIRELRFD